jgi:hypothetical protein
MDHELRAPFTWRGGLRVVKGIVIRFVFDGAPTVYIHGAAQGSPFEDADGGMKIRVSALRDDSEREHAVQVAATSKGVDVSDVRWARF